MLSAESQAALAYFVAPDLDDAVFAGAAGTTAFDHEVVSLNWGGKRDYATWFSAEPSAIAGIQLIPLSPTSMGYLTSEGAGGAEKVAALVAEAAPDGFDGALGDYVLMYSALRAPRRRTRPGTRCSPCPGRRRRRQLAGVRARLGRGRRRRRARVARGRGGAGRRGRRGGGRSGPRCRGSGFATSASADAVGRQVGLGAVRVLSL